MGQTLLPLYSGYRTFTDDKYIKQRALYLSPFSNGRRTPTIPYKNEINRTLRTLTPALRLQILAYSLNKYNMNTNTSATVIDTDIADATRTSAPVLVAQWNDIPDFLKCSHLAQSLKSDEPTGSFEVPRPYHMSSEELNTLFAPSSDITYASVSSALDQLLPVAQWWGLDCPPSFVLDWVNCIWTHFGSLKLRQRTQYKKIPLAVQLFTHFDELKELYPCMDLFIECMRVVMMFGLHKGLNRYFSIILPQELVKGKEYALAIYDQYPDYKLQPSIINAVIRNGSFDMMVKLHKAEFVWDTYTYTHAVMAGLPYVQYVHTNGCPYDEEEAMQAAIESLHLEVVQYLRDNGNTYWDSECWKHLLYSTISNDTDKNKVVELISYFKEHNCPLTDDIYDDDLVEVDIQTFKLFFHHNITHDQSQFVADTTLNEDLCNIIIDNDLVDFLQFLHEQSCDSISIDSIALAINTGNCLKSLKYMVNKMQIPIDLTHPLIVQALSNQQDSECLTWFNRRFPPS